MSVSSGSDITIPINDSPPPPPSPYGNQNTAEPKPTNGMTGIENGAYQGVEASSLNTDANRRASMKSQTEIPMHDYSPDASAGATASPGVTEAVNAELVQGMNVLDTIPHKPHSEFGPYEKFPEYFISVNQHKKFLRRGEKLSVTKDKRTGSRKWVKYLCWTLGGFLLAAIVTVAVLAAVGLIPEKSSAGTSSLRGVTTTTDMPLQSTEFPSTETSLLLSTTFEPSTENTLPTSDNYVPTAGEVEFTFENADFEDDLNDARSERFKTLAAEVEEDVKQKLETHPDVDIATAHVTQFTSGSIITKLRIGWSKFQLGEEIPDFEKIQRRVSSWKDIGNFTLRPGTTRIYKLYNSCKLSNGDCSDSCAFDEGSLDFVCSCPDDKQLDEEKRTCVQMQPLPPSPSSEDTSTHPPHIPSTQEPHASQDPSLGLPSEEPSAIPEEPHTATQKPTPLLSSEEPNTLPEEPIPTSENPITLSPSEGPNPNPQEPSNATENTTSFSPSEEPNLIPGIPFTGPQEPVVATENPLHGFSSEEPQRIPEESILIPEEPITAQEEPILISQEPITAQEEPILIPQEPITAQEEPIVIPQEPITAQEEPIVIPQEPITILEPSSSTTTTTTTETPQLTITAHEPIEKVTTEEPEHGHPPIQAVTSESPERTPAVTIVEVTATPPITTTTTTTQTPILHVGSEAAEESHGRTESANEESPIDATDNPTGILELLSRTSSSTLRPPVTPIDSQETPSRSSVENVDANPLINTTALPAVEDVDTAAQAAIRHPSPGSSSHSLEQETVEEGITILPAISSEEMQNTRSTSQSRKTSRAFPVASNEEGMSPPPISPPPITHSDEFMLYSDANMNQANNNATANTTMPTISDNSEHVLPADQHHTELSSYENVSGGGESVTSAEDSHEFGSGERKSERLVEATQDVNPLGSNSLPMREREEMTTTRPPSLINDTLVNEVIENATEDVNSESVTPQVSTSPAAQEVDSEMVIPQQSLSPGETHQAVVDGSPQTNQSEQPSPTQETQQVVQGSPENIQSELPSSPERTQPVVQESPENPQPEEPSSPEGTQQVVQGSQENIQSEQPSSPEEIQQVVQGSSENIQSEQPSSPEGTQQVVQGSPENIQSEQPSSAEGTQHVVQGSPENMQSEQPSSPEGIQLVVQGSQENTQLEQHSSPEGTQQVVQGNQENIQSEQPSSPEETQVVQGSQENIQSEQPSSPEGTQQVVQGNQENSQSEQPSSPEETQVVQGSQENTQSEQPSSPEGTQQAVVEGSPETSQSEQLSATEGTQQVVQGSPENTQSEQPSSPEKTQQVVQGSQENIQPEQLSLPEATQEDVQGSQANIESQQSSLSEESRQVVEGSPAESEQSSLSNGSPETAHSERTTLPEGSHAIVEGSPDTAQSERPTLPEGSHSIVAEGSLEKTQSEEASLPQGSHPVAAEGSHEMTQSEQSSPPENAPFVTPATDISITTPMTQLGVSPSQSIEERPGSSEERIPEPTKLPGGTSVDPIVSLLEEIHAERTSPSPIQPSQSQESIFSTSLPILDGNESRSNGKESDDITGPTPGDFEPQAPSHDNSSESDNELSH